MAKFVNKWFFLLISILFSFCLKAQEDGSEVVDTIPEYVKLYDKACLLIDSVKYEEALPILKKIIKINSGYYFAFNKIALIYIRQNKNYEAAKTLEKADKINSINYETLKLKGINFFEINRFQESQAAVDSAVAIAFEDKIDDAELLYYQAQLMNRNKSYKKALATCQVALEMKPKYINVLVLKADVRFAMKDFKNAVADYNEALAEMPAEKPDYRCYSQRAKSKSEIKDFKGAITDWSVFIDGNPQDEEALISRAVNKININDNSGAIVDLDEAIKINSKNPVSFCNRGIAKAGNKIYVEAKKDLDYAIKLKFDYGAAFVNRAAVKMASKDKIGACEDLEKADSLGDAMAIKLIERYCKENKK